MASITNVTEGNVLPHVTDRNVVTNVTNVTIEELNAMETAKFLGVLIFCVVVLTIGLIGNVLVLIIYKLKFKRSSARTYILALAMADVSVCLIGIPYHVLDLTMLLVYDSVATCKLLSSLIGICTNSSIFILLVVGLDRFLKVCRPLKKQIVDFGDRRACVIAVVVAISVSVPNAVLYGHSTVKTSIDGLNGVECYISDDHVESMFAIGFMSLNILIFIASLLFLVVIYGFICKKIYDKDNEGEINLGKTKHWWCNCFSHHDEGDCEDEVTEMFVSSGETTVVSLNNTHDIKDGNPDENRAPLTDSENLNSSKNRSNTSHDEGTGVTNEYQSNKGRPRKTVTGKPSTGMVRHVQNKEKHTRKITLMMLSITAVFALSYLPFIVICMLTALDETYWDGMGHTESVISDLILRIYLLNNATNPIIYSFLDLRFRREVVTFFKRLFGCGQADGKSAFRVTSRYTMGTTRKTVAGR